MRPWKRKPADSQDDLGALANVPAAAQLGGGRRRRIPGARTLMIALGVGLAVACSFLLGGYGKLSALASPEGEVTKVSAPPLPMPPEREAPKPAGPPPPQNDGTPIVDRLPFFDRPPPPNAAASAAPKTPASKTPEPPKPPPEKNVITSVVGEQQQPVQVASAGNSRSDAWNARLQSTPVPVQRARVIENPSLTLAHGTLIPCRLDTLINTDQPGEFSCHTTQNAYSMADNISLMDIGTKVSGKILEPLARGKTHVFALFDSAVTPQYVYVPLNSPAVGGLGEAGLEGYVDEHTWQQLKGAIFVSLVADFGQALANSQNRSEMSFNNTTRGAQDAATEALRGSVNIEPTLTKLPGEIIYVRVVGFKTFDDVYELVARQ